MRRIFIFFFILICNALSPTEINAQSIANCNITGIEVDSGEQALFSRVNQWRIQNINAPSMELSTPLNRAAQWMAREVDNRVNYGHVDSLGRYWPQRFLDCGYPTGQGTGESIKVNATADEAFDYWISNAGTGMHAPVVFKCAGIGHYGNSWTVTFAVAVNGACPQSLGAAPTIPPTSNPTNTPTATITPISCPPGAIVPNTTLKGSGDANCNGRIDLGDYNLWRDEFIALLAGDTVRTKYSDFNTPANDVGLGDYNIWRNNFILTLGL